MDDFKKLSFRDAAEAVKLFRSRDFYEILKYEDKRIQALYENMRKWELDQQALEEFLVGCKQKEKIFLTLEEGKPCLYVSFGSQKRNVYDKEKYMGISGD